MATKEEHEKQGDKVTGGCFVFFSQFKGKKENRGKCITTVDGRNPAPLGCLKSYK